MQYDIVATGNHYEVTLTDTETGTSQLTTVFDSTDTLRGVAQASRRDSWESSLTRILPSRFGTFGSSKRLRWVCLPFLSWVRRRKSSVQQQDDLEPAIGINRTIIASNPVHSATRQGERSAHVFRAVLAHAVDLSAWQTLQAFGIFNASVVTGVTKLNVWLRTFTSAMVCWIFGIWQAIHSLPGLPTL
jgi:hypothetical protein